MHRVPANGLIEIDLEDMCVEMEQVLHFNLPTIRLLMEQVDTFFSILQHIHPPGHWQDV